MNKKEVVLTNRVWAETAKVLALTKIHESWDQGGGMAVPPDIPIPWTELILKVVYGIIDEYRIPLSVKDEIVLEFHLNGRGDMIEELRVVIREREGNY